MTHLTDLELLAIAEGNDGDGAPAHLDACGACREKLAALRDALNLAAAVEIPEPSPLFWDHFSARVQSSLQDVEPGTTLDQGTGWRRWGYGSPFVKVATATAVLLLAVIASLTLRTTAPDSTTKRPDTILGTAGPAPGESTAALIGDPNDDADGAWALVRDAADDVTWDDAVASGWIVPAGSADEAALTLTAEERGELVHLLLEETKRTGA